MRKKFTKKKGGAGLGRKTTSLGSRRSSLARTRTPKSTNLRMPKMFESNIPMDIFIKETNLEVELKIKLINNLKIYKKM